MTETRRIADYMTIVSMLLELRLRRSMMCWDELQLGSWYLDLQTFMVP